MSVGGLQRVEHVQTDAGRTCGSERPLRLDQVVQAGRVHQLHHDEGVAALFDDVEDGDRVRVA